MTRFAPSITGRLHLGHVANAALTWGLARATGGAVLLRLEDHDRSRFRPEHETALLDDLDWLGLVPDRGRTDEFRAGAHELRQSDRRSAHDAVLAELADAGLTYRCACTRASLRRRLEAAGHPPQPGVETPYDGRCRDRAVTVDAESGCRLRLSDEEVTFEDAAVDLGQQVQRPSEQCGDLLLVDRAGQVTYQLGVVVDDRDQGVDLVIRGRDILDSTGRQLLLARALGRDRGPVHLHHPLIVDDGGRKLSKSDGATGLDVLRERGHDAATVLGRAAWLIGLQEEPEPVRAEGLGALVGKCLD